MQLITMAREKNKCIDQHVKFFHRLVFCVLQAKLTVIMRKFKSYINKASEFSHDLNKIKIEIGKNLAILIRLTIKVNSATGSGPYCITVKNGKHLTQAIINYFFISHFWGCF